MTANIEEQHTRYLGILKNIRDCHRLDYFVCNLDVVHSVTVVCCVFKCLIRNQSWRKVVVTGLTRPELCVISLRFA